ncbi:MAG: hypothetical protein FWG80_03585 [Alphaproteobacteria bacterium]|nr:hypothetical protein [Alphaproteobacteria bacterium]
MKKVLFIVCCLLFAPFVVSAAPNLTDTVYVEHTAETATAAKSVAMSSARRQVFNRVLARYAERGVIDMLSAEMTDSQLLNMIGTSSIANERISATAYSANVTVTLDRTSVERWLRDNNVPNYMEAVDDFGTRAQVFFQIAGGLREWAALTRDLREAGVWRELDVKLSSIWGHNVSATIAGGRKPMFIREMRRLGWNVSDQDGIVRVSR